MTRAGASPGTASVAMAKLKAAPLSVRPQGLDEGTQDSVHVVPEKDALILRLGKLQLPPQHHSSSTQRRTLPQRVYQVHLIKKSESVCECQPGIGKDRWGLVCIVAMAPN